MNIKDIRLTPHRLKTRVPYLWSQVPLKWSVNVVLLFAILFVHGFSAVNADEAKWPAFMPNLQPGISSLGGESDLLHDISVTSPSEDESKIAAAFSGAWTGWAGANQVVHVELVVKSVQGNTAELVVLREVEGHPQLKQHLKGVLSGEQIEATLESGTKAFYRLRNPDVIELLWQNDRGYMAGVLSKLDRKSVRSTHRIPTPFKDKGKPVTLEAVVYSPVQVDQSRAVDNAGRVPLLIFNHGSTGDGKNLAFRSVTVVSPSVARYFTQRGWMVVFPQRRGRGKSDGTYNEGMEPDGVGYSFETEISLQGYDHASEDIDAVIDWLGKRPDVDMERLVISGHSRGGALAIGYAGENPEMFQGVVNFVGGWMGGGIDTGKEINQNIFASGAGFKGQTLWLYAKNDPFYSLSHSRENFKAFENAGGEGEFLALPVQDGINGHFVHSIPGLWRDAINTYLNKLGL